MLSHWVATLLLPPRSLSPVRSAAKVGATLSASTRAAAAARTVFFMTFAFLVAICQAPAWQNRTADRHTAYDGRISMREGGSRLLRPALGRWAVAKRSSSSESILPATH